MADSINLLSNNWNLADTASTGALSGRTASNTIYNAAFLAGMTLLETQRALVAKAELTMVV